MRRFTRLALIFVAVVAASGVLNSLVRLLTPLWLVESNHGLLVLIKAAALIGLAMMGWWHRCLALPALEAERPQTFVRLACVEVLVFAITIGIAVGLSRTPDPAPEVPAASRPGAVLQGVAVDAPLTVSQ